MNFKTTVVMLVLLAGIAGAYLWLRSAGPATPPSPQEVRDTFVTGRAFQRITLEQDGQTLELEQTDAGWWQTQPVRFPVTGEAIETLVNAALSLSAREMISFAQDQPDATPPSDALASFGLEPPRATVTYVSDTGTHRLHLGNTNLAGSAYLQIEGDQDVYLVDATLHLAAIDGDPMAWRPPQLPTLDARRVNQITLENPGQTLALTRTADGWSLDAEGGERADDTLALQLAAAAQQVKPQGYVSDDPEALGRYGLDAPPVTLTTTDATGATQTLRLGQPADLSGQSVYATWSDRAEPSPVVFVMSVAATRGLDRLTADFLRDPRVVTALPGTIRGQQVNRVGRDTVEIGQRSDGSGGLALVQPQAGYDPDPEQGNAWLTTLTRVEPVGHVRAPREAIAPLALIELRLTGGRTEHVRLYADRDGREDVLLAVRESEAVAALVPREQVAPLLAPVVTLRDRSLPEVGVINELRLTRDDGQVFPFARRADGSWAPPADGFTESWEQQDFARLAAWVDAPRVASWTSMSELPRGPIARLSLGEDRPAYVVNVDQNLGQRTDLPGVFRLPPAVGRLFAEEYRQRLLLPYRPDQITRVDLGIESNEATAAPPPPAAVTRGATGVFTDAEGQRFEQQDECAELFNTLAGLPAKRFIPPLPSEQRQTPIKYWQVRTDDGQTHRLRRYNQGVWSLNDTSYFFIDVDTDRQLTLKDTTWGQALRLP